MEKQQKAKKKKNSYGEILWVAVYFLCEEFKYGDEKGTKLVSLKFLKKTIISKRLIWQM